MCETSESLRSLDISCTACASTDIVKSICSDFLIDLTCMASIMYVRNPTSRGRSTLNGALASPATAAHGCCEVITKLIVQTKPMRQIPQFSMRKLATYVERTTKRQSVPGGLTQVCILYYMTRGHASHIEPPRFLPLLFRVTIKRRTLDNRRSLY